MELPFEDADLFCRLHRSLMFFVNQRLRAINDKPASPEDYSHLPLPTRLKVHKAFLKHPELIDAFVAENPFGLDESELEIVGAWKHFVAGEFYVLRHLKNYTVFLSSTSPAVAYGVVALFEPLDDLIGLPLPALVETTLFPFKGRIVYDGLLNAFNVLFGPGVRGDLDWAYKEAKLRQGIVTTLPPNAASAAPAAAKRSTTKAKKKLAMAKDVSRIPEAVRPARDRVVALTDEFCRERLDDDFAALCREMADVLARKRPSPLARGKAESWACGIVLAVGFANFMNSDRSQPHYMPPADVYDGFGVSKATGASKSLEIRRMLDVHRLSPEWTLPSLMERNPLAQLAGLANGSMDVRSLPVEMLELFSRLGLDLDPLDDEEDDGRQSRPNGYAAPSGFKRSLKRMRLPNGSVT